MNADLALKRITTTRIITVLRGDFPPEKAIAVSEILLENGLDVVELTYNSPDWRKSLSALKTAFPDDLLIGMGTLLNTGHVQEAIDGGADFLVSAILDAPSVSTAHAAGMLMAPGVATPSEAVAGAKLGCKLLKFFPAGALGIDYFKAMRGPLDNLAFTCNGNMHTGNIGEFLQAGAAVCGMAGAGLAGNGERPLAEIRSIAQNVAAILREVNAKA